MVRRVGDERDRATPAAGPVPVGQLPRRSARSRAGRALAEPGIEVFHDAFELGNTDDEGRQIWTQRWWFEDGEQPADGDVALQRAGWITVTPMRLGEVDRPRFELSAPLPSW